MWHAADCFLTEIAPEKSIQRLAIIKLLLDHHVRKNEISFYWYLHEKNLGELYHVATIIEHKALQKVLERYHASMACESNKVIT